MSNPTLASLLKKTGDPELLEKLTNQLSLSELNSLLLEVFRSKSENISPADLLKAYQSNRFVSPSQIDALTFLKVELTLLELAKKYGFEPLELSPLAPLGSCSAIALADQNKIVSAVRNTEVVADATNLMALEAAVRRKASGFDLNAINFSAAHRHVRAQALPPVKGFTAHFKIFCAVTAGKDTGKHEFEKEAVLKHFSLYSDFLVNELKLSEVKIILKVLKEEGSDLLLASRILNHLAGKLGKVYISMLEVPRDEHRYYHQIRFSINVIHNNQEFNLGDGGFVDWNEKLTGNKKEKMLASGLGLELLLKLTGGLI